MDSPSIAISINIKIKDQEIIFSVEEARSLYSQLQRALQISYPVSALVSTRSNWETP